MRVHQSESKHDPFTAPKGYFDQRPRQMADQITQDRLPRKRNIKAVWSSVAACMLLALAFSLGVRLPEQQKPEVPTSQPGNKLDLHWQATVEYLAVDASSEVHLMAEIHFDREPYFDGILPEDEAVLELLAED